jgi:hypothetical protein
MTVGSNSTDGSTSQVGANHGKCFGDESGFVEYHRVIFRELCVVEFEMNRDRKRDKTIWEEREGRERGNLRHRGLAI